MFILFLYDIFYFVVLVSILINISIVLSALNDSFGRQ